MCTTFFFPHSCKMDDFKHTLYLELNKILIKIEMKYNKESQQSFNHIQQIIKDHLERIRKIFQMRKKKSYLYWQWLCSSGWQSSS